MNIKEFKEGDIITREKRCNGDGSYIGDKFIFIGYESPIIALIKDYRGRLEEYLIEVDRDEWLEDWKFYPVSLIEKMKKKIIELVKGKK
jgi:hypothetical protein